MKTTNTIPKENISEGHLCQCGSQVASATCEKDESAVSCGCGEGHSHEGHHHEDHVCGCDHHHEGHIKV